MIKPKDITPVEVGVIHGRFQVLHNDHVKYLMAGKERCRKLVVGITNPDPRLTGNESSDPKRADPSANPLTYFERHCLVTDVLQHRGVSPETFTVVPFPINFPELYQYYLPLDALFFLTIYDDWGRTKRDYFVSLGLATHVLWEVPPAQKGLSAADVRRRIRTGADWEHLVPPVVATRLKEWDIPRRLKMFNPQNKVRPGKPPAGDPC